MPIDQSRDYKFVCTVYYVIGCYLMGLCHGSDCGYEAIFYADKVVLFEKKGISDDITLRYE
jgi:hypothetical protein